MTEELEGVHLCSRCGQRIRWNGKKWTTVDVPVEPCNPGLDYDHRTKDHDEYGKPVGTQAGVKKAGKGIPHCSACGSTAPHHLAYVKEHGKCVV